MQALRAVSFLWTGNKNFTRDGYLRAAKNFDDSVMARKLEGKVCLVTGANSGIGFKTSEELAAHGATVLMVCRNQTRGEQAVAKVLQTTGNQNVHLKLCDLSNLSSIVALVKELESSGSPLHVLINNAGLMMEAPQTSADGLEYSFAANTLGTFALTYLLQPLLKKSAPSRVVIVSSGGMLTEKLEVKDLENKNMKKYDGMVAYARDKRRQVALTEKFAEELQGTGVGVYAMHPGWTDTDGVQKSMPGFHNTFKAKLRDLQQGCDTIVWLALQDMDKLESGAFYFDRAPAAKHLGVGGTQYTKQDVDQLWNKLLEILKSKQPEALPS